MVCMVSPRVINPNGMAVSSVIAYWICDSHCCAKGCEICCGGGIFSKGFNRHAVNFGVCITGMQVLKSQWWLAVSQSGCLLITGWGQWTIQGTVSLVVPLSGMIVGVYIHLMWLRHHDEIPRMPESAKSLLQVSSGSALCMILMYCGLQPWTEVQRVAKVLPLLLAGLSVMNWVLMVCLIELVGHFWASEDSSESDSSTISSAGGTPSNRD